jgi:pSer/pThr/pTyr-binding forkhead associated (FHA) protein
VATQCLVIDRDDKGRFFLSFEGGVVTIGDQPQDAEFVLRNLHVARIHCEVEVEEKVVVVAGAKAPLGQKPLHKELHPGEAVRLGHTEFRLQGGPEAAAPLFKDDEIIGFADEVRLQPASGPAPAPSPAPAGPAPESAANQMIKQLVVIDGGDKGRVFLLPDSGVCTIGKSNRHADIILHDLYVARIHCELRIQGDSVRVVHVEGQNGTLIDGQQITEQQMQLGSVLRVGNSHLRLETAVRTETSQAKKDTRVDTVAESSEDIVEVGDVEIIEDIVEVVDGETAEASTSEQGQAYALPHSPIDQLLKLEDQTLGHFKVGALLGRGQSGLVFRAQDVNTKQVVALKVLSPDFPASDEELQHFVQALKVLPQLVHPNLVTLLRAGRSGPCCWIAREHVDGEGLARVISRPQPNGRDWTLACRVILDVAKALRFLHERKVTHGNITPRNILMAKNKASKLADLMLNRALQGSQLQKVILQKKLLAEAAFLAPEQTMPQGSVNPLTDLYALGVIAYALLVGQPPFTGSSLQEIATQIREVKVVRPSKQQRDIPAPFEAVVLKMMARRREDRFQSAAEVLAFVEPIAGENGIAV